MKLKRIMALSVLLGTFNLLIAQNFTYEWKRVRMDSSFESGKIFEVDSIVAAHQQAMGPLMEIIIYAEAEIEEKQPESALTNIAADMLLYAASDLIDNGYPTMSLTNYGGIRNNFPKGAVRVYDIYSTFPFNNYLVVAVLEGKDIRKILDSFASRERFEALGGVEIVVKDKELEKCFIGGTPLEDERLYNVVTIDFLLDGGDRFRIGDNAISVNRTGLVMRDVAIKYLKGLSADGVVLVNKGDGRVKIMED